MQRRDFITLLGGAAAAWPLAARAQTAPVVGYLYPGSPEPTAHYLAAFRKGLSETGYVEGRSLTIEFRFAHNDVSRLPELAADLVRRRVAVIAVPASNSAAVAAKAATSTIPIVFGTATDPVQTGLVASLNRPSGNATGISNMGLELSAKQVGLLHELLPRATRYAALVYLSSSPNIADIRAAASTLGKQVEILTATTNREIDIAFENLVQKHVEALLVPPHPLFANRLVQLATLASHHRVPALYSRREYAEVGGLMSYGSSITDQIRQIGIYVGRILKGEKPADLPVMQPTKFEFVINLQTARTLGIDVPATLLAISDEVIE